MMKKISKIRDLFLSFLAIVFVLLAFSCGNKHIPGPTDGVNRGDSSDDDQVDDLTLSNQDVDSLKFYTWYYNLSDSANVPLYFWYEQFTDPMHFNWKQYADGQGVMDAIASVPKVDGKQVDRYSFLDLTGEVSQQLEGGIQGDMGMMVAAVLDDQSGSNGILLFVEYVYPGSPAAKAGIARGDEIVSINGNEKMNNDDATFDRINQALFGSESVQLETQRGKDGTVVSKNLNVAQYHINPILFDTVYQDFGTKKVGYFVYNSFLSVSSSGNGKQAKSEIDDVFSKFKSEGVQDLIVDLRYNGGGSVNAAAYLDNLMAPASAVGQEMFRTIYNDPLTEYFEYWKDRADEDVEEAAFAKNSLDPTYFESQSNNLNLSRVFFIVSKGTASASELTINNLKPFMDVYLVGDTTNGKPVGFFGTPIAFETEHNGFQHVADMYSINFQSVNNEGEGDYFFGMNPDVKMADFVDLNWGDELDPSLITIESFIAGNGFKEQDDILRLRQDAEARLATPSRGIRRRLSTSKKLVNPHTFNGMVEFLEKGRLGKKF